MDWASPNKREARKRLQELLARWEDPAAARLMAAWCRLPEEMWR